MVTVGIRVFLRTGRRFLMSYCGWASEREEWAGRVRRLGPMGGLEGGGGVKEMTTGCGAHHLDAAVGGSVEHLGPHGQARVGVEPLHDEAVALVFLRVVGDGAVAGESNLTFTVG